MKYLISFIGLSLLLVSNAQKPFFYVQGEVVHIDTLSLKNVEDYGRDDFVIDLGNHGSPSLNLAPDLNDFVTNDYSLLTFQARHQFRKYNVYKPIVDAKYVIGSGQEQHFSVLHSQNINKKTNYSIGLDKINSKGIYQNQSTDVTDIFFNMYGKDLAKGKYNFDLSFDYKNAATSLNGGLENDSSFTHDTLDLQNRELLDINLAHAYQEKKAWFGELRQSLVLFNSFDSTETGVKWALRNRLGYEDYARVYYDSILNTSFYDRILNDSSITNESSNYQSLFGYLGIAHLIEKENRLFWTLGAQTSYNRYRHVNVDTNRLDVEAIGEFMFVTSTFGITAELKYLVNDSYANNDYNIKLKGNYNINEKFALNAGIYMSNERPQLDLLAYASNHVTWTNDFEKYQINHFNLGIEYSGKWKPQLAFNYFDIHNPIYFGYDKTPYQADGVAQLIRTSLSVDKYFKRWDLSGQVHYQYLGGYNVFRVPSLLTKLNVSWKFKAFKKKMKAAIGAEITYFNKYESKSFDPVSGQYYIYSNEEVGNYPYVDVFIKSRVQRATFFLMLSHPHQGLLGNNYFLFPNYPANDRFFRIGISWLFVN